VENRIRLYEYGLADLGGAVIRARHAVGRRPCGVGHRRKNWVLIGHWRFGQRIDSRLAPDRSSEIWALTGTLVPGRLEAGILSRRNSCGGPSRCPADRRPGCGRDLAHQRRLGDWKHGLDAAVDVARHQVRRAQIDLILAAIFEIENAGCARGTGRRCW